MPNTFSLLASITCGFEICDGGAILTHVRCLKLNQSVTCLSSDPCTTMYKLIWLVVGGEPAARSHKVEQFTAL